jgi:hypothetical protein
MEGPQPHSIASFTRRAFCAALLAVGLYDLGNSPARSEVSDPLPSWNDGIAKQAIVDFVARVTTEGGAEYVKPAERIATFDNDGTLWAEQPIYFQFAFAFDRVKALAPQHPRWKEQQPFAAVLSDDTKALHRGWNICSCQPPDRDAKKGASCETPFRRCAGRGREPPSSRSYAALGVAIAAFAPSVPIGIWRGFCASGSSRERST